MLGKLAVALMIVASPALADEPAPAAEAAAPAQEYTVKKVCRTVEVAGSFIPRTTCVNKKVPVKKPDPVAQETTTQSGATDGAAKEQ